MRVLVTGGSGFLGSELVPFLQLRGMEVIQLNRGRAARTRGSLVWGSKWRQECPAVDAVVHLAALAHQVDHHSAPPLAEFQRINCDLTQEVARFALGAGARRFVFLSSIGVLGNHGHFDATSEPRPVEDYARSKRDAEDALTRLFNSTSDCELTIIRPPLVYGPRPKGNIERLIRLIERIPVLPFGSVTAERSYVSVANLCDLIATCLARRGSCRGPYLASDGHDLTLTELLRLMGRFARRRPVLLPMSTSLLSAGAELLGRGPDMQRLLRPLTVDISQTVRELSWKPTHSVEAEIERMMLGGPLGPPGARHTRGALAPAQ